MIYLPRTRLSSHMGCQQFYALTWWENASGYNWSYMLDRNSRPNQSRLMFAVNRFWWPTGSINRDKLWSGTRSPLNLLTKDNCHALPKNISDHSQLILHFPAMNSPPANAQLGTNLHGPCFHSWALCLVLLRTVYDLLCIPPHIATMDESPITLYRGIMSICESSLHPIGCHKIAYYPKSPHHEW